jgi:hypothetical protein
MIPVLKQATRHKDVWWNGDISPRVHNFGIRCRGLICFTLPPSYLWGRRLGTSLVREWEKSRNGLDTADQGKILFLGKNRTLCSP